MRPIRGLLERLGLVRAEQACEHYSDADAAVVAAHEATVESRHNRLTADYEAAEQQRLTRRAR